MSGTREKPRENTVLAFQLHTSFQRRLVLLPSQYVHLGLGGWVSWIFRLDITRLLSGLSAYRVRGKPPSWTPIYVGLNLGEGYKLVACSAAASPSA